MLQPMNPKLRFPSPLPAFQAIAAMSENRVIGRGGGIPWHLPEDFKWFKKMTTGQVLVMGRKTFESIGRPLPDRETVILSRREFQAPGTATIRDPGELPALVERFPGRTLWIVGGAQVYEQCLPLCSDLYVTHVKRTVEGDVFFPPFEDCFQPIETVMENADFRIVHYRHRSLPGTERKPVRSSTYS